MGAVAEAELPTSPRLVQAYFKSFRGPTELWWSRRPPGTGCGIFSWPRALTSGLGTVCRLVPAAKNSGGKQRQQRSKDGKRYLKLAFHHAAVRAIQYFPEIKRFYQGLARRKPKGVARAIVAKELARTVYFALSRQEHFNGTLKGVPLSRRKTVQWPRLANPPV